MSVHYKRVVASSMVDCMMRTIDVRRHGRGSVHVLTHRALMRMRSSGQTKPSRPRMRVSYTMLRGKHQSKQGSSRRCWSLVNVFPVLFFTGHIALVPPHAMGAAEGMQAMDSRDSDDHPAHTVDCSIESSLISPDRVRLTATALAATVTEPARLGAIDPLGGCSATTAPPHGSAALRVFFQVFLI